MSNPQVTIGISAVDTARQTLAQVDQKIQNTTQLVEQSGSRITAIGERIKQNWQNLATAAAGLTAGVVGFATSFSTLEKAKVGADRATLTYEKSLERLNEMQAKGTFSATELANQQELVRINAEKAKLAQDSLNDTYANFLANIPSQLMSFGVAANGIFTMLKGQHISTAATAQSSSIAYSGALASMNASTVTTSRAMQLFRVASISAFITNPVTIAILGITTLIAALAFNVGGLRDRVFELGAAILAFLDKHFKPLADAIRWFIDNVAKPLGSFFGNEAPPAIDTTTQAIITLDQATIELGQHAPVAISQVETAVVSMNTAFETAIRTFDRAKLALDPIGDAFRRTGTSSTSASAGRDATVINALAASGAGISTFNQLAKQTGAISIGGIGRVLDSGGTLYEDVIGFGTSTGTPHMLHAGEDVVPRGKGRATTIVIPVILNGREIARATYRDIGRLIDKENTDHMRTTHEASHTLG